MAKIRKDYENSWWPRFLRWVSGGSTRLDNQLQEELVESSEAHLVQSPEEAAQMERQAEERVQKALQDERSRVPGSPGRCTAFWQWSPALPSFMCCCAPRPSCRPLATLITP